MKPITELLNELKRNVPNGDVKSMSLIYDLEKSLNKSKKSMTVNAVHGYGGFWNVGDTLTCQKFEAIHIRGVEMKNPLPDEFIKDGYLSINITDKMVIVTAVNGTPMSEISSHLFLFPLICII
jgi:hypothetical protein